MTGQELSDAFLKYLDGKHPPRAPANQVIAMLFGTDEVQWTKGGSSVTVPGLGELSLNDSVAGRPEWAAWFAVCMDADGWFILASDADPFVPGESNPLPQANGLVYAVPAGFFPPQNPAFTDPAPAAQSRQARRAEQRAARKAMVRRS